MDMYVYAYHFLGEPPPRLSHPPSPISNFCTYNNHNTIRCAISSYYVFVFLFYARFAPLYATFGTQLTPQGAGGTGALSAVEVFNVTVS